MFYSLISVNRIKNAFQESCGVISKQEFIFERVLKKRVTREGVIEDFFKWLGYPDSYNLWEPQKLLLSNELIVDYLRRENIMAVTCLSRKQHSMI